MTVKKTYLGRQSKICKYFANRVTDSTSIYNCHHGRAQTKLFVLIYFNKLVLLNEYKFIKTAIGFTSDLYFKIFFQIHKNVF